MGFFRDGIPRLFLILVLGLSACSKSQNFTPAPAAPVTPPVVEKLSENCVQVFYDKTHDPGFDLGRIYAMMLLNLLGHFPEHQQVIGDIESYQKGDLDRCYANFYIGSYYDNLLPADFIADYKATTKQFVWIGYNFWRAGETFQNEFGYSDFRFTTLDRTNTTPDGKPSFFRDVLYKGETFNKYGEWSNSGHTQFAAAFEVTHLLMPVAGVTPATSLADIRHSYTNEVIPWAYASNTSPNKFYVTEVPFSYIHEADRYLVFADLLFDFLKAPARHNAKNALIRLEDIHPYVELRWLNRAVNILQNQGVTPHISIIPVFRDPYFAFGRDDGDTREEIPMEEKPDFFSRITELKNSGSVFIWHGTTHQYKSEKNPYSATSGDDYEFWNYNTSGPVAGDGVDYVLNKLDYGFNSLRQAGIAPKAWLTPHYHGSALDNLMFGQIFDWVVSRGVYSDFTLGGTYDAAAFSKPLGFDLNDVEGRKANRREFFNQFSVTQEAGVREFGQIYPYEIYGDIYGQNVVPENLGNVQPELNDQVVQTRSVDQILADAKRNLVLRDVWASAFYHPFLIGDQINDPDYDSSQPLDFKKLVTGLKNLGYRFINLDDYISANTTAKGKPRLELSATRGMRTGP